MVNPNKAPRPSTSKKPGPATKKTLTIEQAVAKAIQTGQAGVHAHPGGVIERCPIIKGDGKRCTRWDDSMVTNLPDPNQEGYKEFGRRYLDAKVLGRKALGFYDTHGRCKTHAWDRYGPPVSIIPLG